ncbi:MAG: L,D-transpeptidase/peptidoglycan binding protein [Coriobacteriales bacterium]|jgi:hypothetical protein|nr:L,D-transpeptidase/peptidoglycan binding protein [Coriobacteriales bacterium]
MGLRFRKKTKGSTEVENDVALAVAGTVPDEAAPVTDTASDAASEDSLGTETAGADDLGGEAASDGTGEDGKDDADADADADAGEDGKADADADADADEDGKAEADADADEDGKDGAAAGEPDEPDEGEGEEKEGGAAAAGEPGELDEPPTPAEEQFAPGHVRIVEKRSFFWLWMALGTAFGLLLAGYLGLAVFFNYHYGFNTSVNGVDISFLTPAQAEDVIRDQVDRYTLKVVSRSGTHVIPGSQIELRYISDNQLQRLLYEQNVFLWGARLFNPSSADHLAASVTFNLDKLNAAIDSFSFMDTSSMVAPADAYAEFVDSAYRVHPEVRGTTLNTIKTRAAIIAAVYATEGILDLEESGAYQDPKVFGDSSALARDIELYNKYVPFSISYTIGGATETLDGRTTLDWVDIYAPEQTGLDDAAVRSWVAGLASRYDTVGAKRTFMSGYGEEKVVEGGTYGWQIDQEAEVAAIHTAYRERRGEEREPHCVSRAASFGAFDWGQTYAEVDLTEQHMWYFRDGELIMESDVVTGKPDGFNTTPDGVYYLLDMQSPSVLRGRIMANGQPEYITPVSFWMPVTVEGVGFHDATWQPTFGGSWYVRNGSHGCINMPYARARELYSLIETGCPVVLHY